MFFAVGYVILVAGLLVYAIRSHLYPNGMGGKPITLGSKPTGDPKTDPAFNVSKDVLIPEGQAPVPPPKVVAPVPPPAPPAVVEGATSQIPPPIPAAIEPLKQPQI